MGGSTTGAGALTKEDGGTLLFTADPNETGTFTINGGVLALQHSGTTDAPFIINSSGTLRVLTANDLGDIYNVTVNAGGTLDLRGSDTIAQLLGAGTVTNNGAAAMTLAVNSATNPPTPFSGVLQNGASTLGFSKGGANTVTLTGANTYTGTTTISTATLIVTGNTAAISGSTAVNIGDNNAGAEALTVGAVGDVWSGGPLNRLADAANVTVNGSSIGGLNYTGPAAGSSGNVETIATLTISNGRNNVTLITGTGNDVQLTAGTLVRANNGTVLFRGDNLGGTGAGSTRLVFGTAPAVNGGGGADGSTVKSIIAFATGGGNATSAGTDFVTYDATNGVRLLTAGEYAGTIAGTPPLRNVSVRATGEAVTAEAAVNSLRVTDGGTVTIAAGQHVNVRSGAVLIVGNGTAFTGGIAGPGFLDFGAGEGLIHLAQNTTATTATLGARIAGTNGFSYGRNGDAVNLLDLGGDNTIIGTVRINQGSIRLQNPGALNDNYPVTVIGRATSALQILGNNVAIRDIQATAGTLTLTNGAATAATLTTYLTAARTLSTALTNGGTGALNLAVSAGAFALTHDADSSATGRGAHGHDPALRREWHAQRLHHHRHRRRHAAPDQHQRRQQHQPPAQRRAHRPHRRHAGFRQQRQRAQLLRNRRRADHWRGHQLHQRGQGGERLDLRAHRRLAGPQHRRRARLQQSEQRHRDLRSRHDLAEPPRPHHRADAGRWDHWRMGLGADFRDRAGVCEIRRRRHHLGARAGGRRLHGGTDDRRKPRAECEPHRHSRGAHRQHPDQFAHAPASLRDHRGPRRGQHPAPRKRRPHREQRFRRELHQRHAHRRHRRGYRGRTHRPHRQRSRQPARHRLGDREQRTRRGHFDQSGRGRPRFPGRDEHLHRQNLPQRRRPAHQCRREPRRRTRRAEHRPPHFLLHRHGHARGHGELHAQCESRPWMLRRRSTTPPSAAR